ncbi:hypothetical protein [Metabacillus fastidiosus]|uniref:hypothetical protein n=1 Tax=Metabacillus fastidiosus TaxID=1458 RepID=UPI003D2C2747
MDIALFLMGIIVFLIGIILLIKNLIKKAPKKKALISVAVGFVLCISGMSIGVANMDPEELAKIEKEKEIKQKLKEEEKKKQEEVTLAEAKKKEEEKLKEKQAEQQEKEQKEKEKLDKEAAQRAEKEQKKQEEAKKAEEQKLAEETKQKELAVAEKKKEEITLSEEKENKNREQQVVEKGSWEQNIKEVAASNKTETEKFTEISLYAQDYNASESEVTEFSKYILTEYISGQYLMDIKNHEYMLTNIFKSEVVDVSYDKKGQGNTPIALFAFDFWQNTKYTYRGVDEIDSHEVKANEYQMNKSLAKMN